MTDDPIADPIAAAVESVEHPKPDSLVSSATFPDGSKVKLIVPLVFTADHFETTVGMLMQLRVTSEQMQAAQANSGLVLPETKLVGVRGEKLS